MLTDIAPAELETVTPVDPVMLPTEYDEALPMRIWPLLGIVVVPVPPRLAANVPVVFDIGRSEQLVRVPEAGVPSAGVTSVGLEIVGAVDRTTLPVPVEVVTPVPPCATERVLVVELSGMFVQLLRLPEAGVPSAPLNPTSPLAVLIAVASPVATPVPRPDMPATGNPVQLLRVPLEGVPSAGVVSDGLVERTTDPDPVDVVTPVPPLATASVPDTEPSGTLVQLLRLPDDGVPSATDDRVLLDRICALLAVVISTPPTFAPDGRLLIRSNAEPEPSKYTPATVPTGIATPVPPVGRTVTVLFVPFLTK